MPNIIQSESRKKFQGLAKTETLVERIGTYKGEAVWKCQCKCGNIYLALESRIRDGAAKECDDCRKHSRRKDIEGQRFGKLTAVRYMFDDKRNQACWLFRCDCGNEKILTYQAVKWNGTQSCGCIRSERTGKINRTDIKGQRFGRLTAISATDQRDASGAIIWKCQCDCGNIVLTSVAKLRKGSVKSCGCLYRETRAEASQKRSDLVEGTNVTSLIASKKPRADNSSGVTGVFYDKRSGKWMAYLSYQKVRHHLGIYSRKEDAVKARKRAEQELHDPVIQNHLQSMPLNRQREYFEYLKGSETGAIPPTRH